MAKRIEEPVQPTRNYGIDLTREIAEQREADWKFGAASQACLFAIPMLEREAYLPKGEVQFTKTDDLMDCASRGPVNFLEAKFNYAYRKDLIKPSNRKWLEDNGYVVDGH